MRPDRSLHRVADFIPQSILQARHYRMQIATYPARRFIEPALAEERAVVLPPSNAPADAESARGVGIACLAMVLACAVILYFIVPLLIGP